jgi:CRP/FNR family cyclic AMP-dependent transcriptional regulator
MASRPGRRRRPRAGRTEVSAGRVAISRSVLAERQAILGRVPLFSELPKRHLREIARVAWISEYPEGTAICHEDRLESAFYVIVEGRARVERRGREIARLSAGDFFGEVSLLDLGRRTADVISETPIRCLQLDGSDFRRILNREPLLATRIATGLARRLRRADRPVLD